MSSDADLILCKETTEPVRPVEPVTEHKNESAGLDNSIRLDADKHNDTHSQFSGLRVIMFGLSPVGPVCQKRRDTSLSAGRSEKNLPKSKHITSE